MTDLGFKLRNINHETALCEYLSSINRDNGLSIIRLIERYNENTFNNNYHYDYIRKIKSLETRDYLNQKYIEKLKGLLK